MTEKLIDGFEDHLTIEKYKQFVQNNTSTFLSTMLAYLHAP